MIPNWLRLRWLKSVNDSQLIYTSSDVALESSNSKLKLVKQANVRPGCGQLVYRIGNLKDNIISAEVARQSGNKHFAFVLVAPSATDAPRDLKRVEN